MGLKNNKNSSSNKEVSVKNSGGSPSKAMSPVKNAVLGSPPGRKSGKNCRKSAKLPPGWYIRSCKVFGGIRLVYVTLSSLVDDAYIHTAVTKLSEVEQDGAEDNELFNYSLWGAADLRISLTNPNPLKNSRNGYTRKVFVQMMDPEDEPDEKGLELCNVFKHFFEQRANNKYETKVFIPEPGWNLDNPDPSVPLPKLDNFLVYKDIRGSQSFLFGLLLKK